MYAAKELKKDTSFSENFVFSVRKMQDNLMSNNYNYARSSEQTAKPEPKIPGEQSRLEAEKLNTLYQAIKESDKTI